MLETSMSDIPMSPSWYEHLSPEFALDYMRGLENFLQQEVHAGKCIYPERNDWFAALNATPLDQVKLVILGQDPYHGAGQAHGLSFSVREGVKIPPSLLNIYKEIQQDIYAGEKALPESGNLQHWAEQGVLLLNSVLTVESGRAGAHQKQGWEIFTDKIIQLVNGCCEHVVFMLWGSYAQKKGEVIDRTKHLVLSAPHPSPLSAHRGFLGCQHFSMANQYLEEQGKAGIEWFKPASESSHPQSCLDF